MAFRWLITRFFQTLCDRQQWNPHLNTSASTQSFKMLVLADLFWGSVCGPKTNTPVGLQLHSLQTNWVIFSTNCCIRGDLCALSERLSATKMETMCAACEQLGSEVAFLFSEHIHASVLLLLECLSVTRLHHSTFIWRGVCTREDCHHISVADLGLFHGLE